MQRDKYISFKGVYWKYKLVDISAIYVCQYMGNRTRVTEILS